MDAYGSAWGEAQNSPINNSVQIMSEYYQSNKNE